MADAATRKGSIGSTEIRLASWLEEPQRYQRRYVPVRIEGFASDVPGAGVPDSRTWRIRSWAGGEGEDLWDAELSSYRKGDGLKPVLIGDGLELGRRAVNTKDSGGASDIVDVQRFGLGQGLLWGIKADNGYSWDRTNERWAAGIATGAAASDATSVTDGDDTFMYSGHENKVVRRWKSGSNAAWYSSFTENPVLRSFGGILYGLDGDDLYEIDKLTVDTRTIRADLEGSSADFLAQTPWCYNRMSLSDKGPIWIQRLDNGQTFIWEYNVALDTQERIGKLPVDFAFPYSLFFTKGFYFVGFRYANDHTEEGDAYLYAFRGAQDSTPGPFRASGSTASKPVLIAGLVGDDLLVYFDEKIWAYNLSDGGIAVVGDQLASANAEDAITFGKEVFTSGMADKVERFLEDEYQAAGSLHTGRHDFDYPGLQKTLLNVTVVTDPLPASTSVTVDVIVDGGTPVSLAGTHSTVGERRFVFTVPVGASTLTGYEFEIVVNGATSSSTATPTIRQVLAEAMAAAHRIEWILGLDCSDMSHEELDNLNALAANEQIVTLTDPWQNRETDAADTFAVKVADVITPELRSSGSKDEAVGHLRLLSRDLTTGLGGS